MFLESETVLGKESVGVTKLDFIKAQTREGSFETHNGSAFFSWIGELT